MRIQRTEKPRRCTALLFGAVAISLAPAAGATTISLGAAADYTVLALEGSHVFMGNDGTTINGNMGIGANSEAFLQKGTVTGVTRHESSAVITTGSSWNGTLQQQSLAQASADAVAASIAFSSLATTRFDITALDSSMTINANAGDNVFSLSHVDLNNEVVTLNGSASDFFIFNITGGMFFSSTDMILTGGLTEANIMFNVVGSDPGEYIYLKNSGNFRGTVLAPDRAIRADHLTIHGALIGGRDATFDGLSKDTASMSIHSDIIVNGIPFMPTSIPIPTPAAFPAGLALLGILGVGRTASRRR